MKKFYALFLLFLVPLFAAQKVRIWKEGPVEVVENPESPVEAKGLRLEKLFEIKLEDMPAEKLASIGAFDTDRAGNLYIFDPKLKKLQVFDRKGKYLRTIGRAGQGPGEYTMLTAVEVKAPYVWAADPVQNKIIIYRRDGTFVREKKVAGGFFDAFFPPGRNIILREIEPAGEKKKFVLNLYSPGFKKIAKLDEVEMFNPFARRIKAVFHTLSVTASKDRIYTASQSRGYEILVYDLEGKLVRKIRRKYRPVGPDDFYRESFLLTLERFRKALEKRLVFPDRLPPLHQIFASDGDYLLAMTYERGSSAGEYLFDVFSPDGIFIDRMSLKVGYLKENIKARFAGDRFYLVKEDDEGESLIVYRVEWTQSE